MWRSILLLTVLFIPVSALSSRAAENSLTARKAMPRKSGFARFRTISFSSGIGSLPRSGCETAAATQPAAYAGNVRLDCDGETPHNETTLAIDPLDPEHAVGGYHAYLFSYNGNTVIRHVVGSTSVTFDGGATWREVVPPIAPYQFTGDPALAFDSHGRVYFSNIADHEGPGGSYTGPSVVVARSDDGGQSWSSPVTVANGSTAITKGKLYGPNVFNDKDFIAADSGMASPFRDRVYVTWTRFTDFFSKQKASFSAPIMLSYSDDGLSWSPGKAISGFSPTLCNARILGAPGQCDVNQESYPAVAPDGKVYVSFTNFNTIVNSQILVVSSKDGGSTWGPPARVDFIQEGNLPLSPEGEPVLTGCRFRLTAKSNTATDPNDPTGNTVYVVWADSRNGSWDPDLGNFRTNSDVFLGRSADGGMTWSVLPVDSSLNDQFFPWVAVAPDGRVDVGYMDRAYSASQAECRYGYSLTRLTFSASGDLASSVKSRLDSSLSDPGNSFWFGTNSAFIGDYSAIAVDTGGRTWALWTDERAPVSEADLRRGQHAVAALAP